MPNICLNVAVTDAIASIATDLEKAVAGGKKIEEAVWGLLPKVIKQHKRIVFNGNNYADEWQKDAKKRGLLNLRNTVDALPELVTPAVIKAFETQKVLNARELKAREEINFETYNKTVNVEAQLMVLIANRYILPAALEYQKDVGQAVIAAKGAGAPSTQGKLLAKTLAKQIDALKGTATQLAVALEHGDGSVEKHAKYFRDKVIPLMAKLREAGDGLELNIPHERWPLPTYREMLFIK
jgi:glutamine synthetase